MTQNSTSSDRGPLTGFRVLDLTVNVLGPLATQLLGDLGADVIKIEVPTGDPMRHFGPRKKPNMASHFLNLNRSKRSLTLDLKRPEARDALFRLIDTADVFVHNMRNKAAERLAFGPDAVRQRNPNIIYAYATGYRADGPKRDRPAFDDIIQGESGIAGILQRATGTPAYIPYAIADKLCGVYLASSVSAALVARERGAGGQVVHVPMLETMVSFNLADHLWGTTYSDRSEDAGYPRMFTRERRPLRTLDGHICLMAVTDDQWNRVFAAIGRDELIGNEKFADMDGRSTNVEELYSIVSEEITKRTTNEWRRRLDEYDLPNAPMKSLTDVLDDAYLRETGMIRCYDHPDGETYTALGFPLHFSETPGGMKRVPPSLGEHSIELLTEVGFSEDEITKITGP
ncbi:MAG: CoA transferase [Hyphomicrobiaceae bacterium]|nr:CoA transferase [Hyphomicrobiaceae bacterium]